MLRFVTWKDAKDHYFEAYGRALNKSIRGGSSRQQNGHGFTLVCNGCRDFLLVVHKRGSAFQMNEEKSTLGVTAPWVR
jgi:hypothetical protein